MRYSLVFVSRIISELRKLPSQSSKTTLSREIMKDFLWWHKFIEVFSRVEIITPTTVCQSVLGDAYPQGGGSWNPVLNEYFSEKFLLYMCSPDTPIHIKKSQKNVLSHLRQLCIFCVIFKVRLIQKLV